MMYSLAVGLKTSKQQVENKGMSLTCIDTSSVESCLLILRLRYVNYHVNYLFYQNTLSDKISEIRNWDICSFFYLSLYQQHYF